MEDSCYEESEFEESSGCDESESDLHSDSDNPECSNSKSVGLDSLDDPVIVFETQDDVGQASTQIPKQVDPPLVEGEPSTNEEDTILIPYKGQTFGAWEEAKAFYTDYARKAGFGVRTRDSRRDRARDNSIIRITFTCDREGRHVPKVRRQDPEKPVVRRNTSTQKCGCMARFVVVVRKDGRWVVSDFHEKHNHDPVTPSKQICMKGRRLMPMAAKALVESFRDINIPVGKVATLLDGRSVGFDARDCYNHLGKKSSYKTPIEGDASAMAEYLWKKQAEDPAFFYAILTDKDSRAINFLWIDGRCRSQYQYFGDVLYFDTTYKKNVYKMPFAPFTGVNHHLQSIQFGCALLLDETEDSFVWAFETWLRAMGGKAPKALITDQDPAMRKAVARVFPNTRHRLCLWHILKKFPEKLNQVYKKKSKFKKQINWCIRGFYRISDFEKRWEQLMIKYELTGNKWLSNLYDIRERWVPVYHLDTFYAGMNTTGRSEGMNSFYKAFFSRHTTLRDFAYRNETCLQRLVEREKREDYLSEHKSRVVDDTSYLLQFAAKLYTRAAYVKFKAQWDLAVSSYKLLTSSHIDEIHSFVYKARNERDPREWKVEFNTNTLEGKCECKLFENMYIPCGHLIKVFQSRDIDEIPEAFIARRWLQRANEYRAKYDSVVVSGHQNSKVLRAAHLAVLANALVYDAAEEVGYYTFMAQKFHDISEQYNAHKTATMQAKSFSSMDSNVVGDTIPIDTQGPPNVDPSQAPPNVDHSQAPPTVDHSEAPPTFDASQAPPIFDDSQAPPIVDDSQAPPTFDDSPGPPIVGNPRISKPKGRDKDDEKGKDDHTSASSRYKYGLEKSQRKRDFKQRECSLCKANGLPAIGHNMRSCILNPNKNK